MAYQGLGSGLDEDAYGVRLLAEKLPEMLVATSSERQGRAIDHDQSGSMELKKRQGYF